MNQQKLDWDCRKFEAKMEKEISNRKMLGNMAESSTFSEHGIMDQFFIFGLPPNNKKQTQPMVLAAFPPFHQSMIPVKNVLSLAMPNWDLANTNTKTKFTNLFSTSEKGIENGIVDQFVFQFNAGETKIYGLCTHIQPSKASRNATLPFFATDGTKKSIFCLCMISKIPIFNAHFTFLNYLVGLCTGTIITTQKNSSLINSIENAYENCYENNYRQDNEIQNDTLIEGFELTGAFGHVPQINIPEEFQSKIFDYYSKTMYSSPSKLAPGYNIYFPHPSTPTQKLILWGSLDTLFSVLNVADIIRLITALILDAQVLIIGNSMQEVSMTVYGLSCLLTPFNYCGIVMPILPNDDDYLDLLNSPTPFIFGMPNIPKLKKMSFLESTYIVNIDKHKISQVDFYPQYPNFNDVLRRIALLITKEANRNKSDDDLLDVSQTIRERSRSAVVGVGDAHTPRQIRIKPTFNSFDRRNNTAFSIQNEKPSEKAENINSSEKVDNKIETNEKEKIEDEKKIESIQKDDEKKIENIQKDETKSENIQTDETKSENIQTDEKKNEIDQKVDDEKKIENIEENETKSEAIQKVDDEKKIETDQKVNDEKEVDINENIETISQFPSFSSTPRSKIRRSYTLTQDDFTSETTTSSPLAPPPRAHIAPSFSVPFPIGPSSQPLQDFPVFKKPVASSDFDNDPNPYKFPTEFTRKLNHRVSLNRENIDKILTALHEPLDFIFTDLLNCYFVTNALENVTIFNQSLFLASVKQEDLSFYEFLLESQTFQDYVETKLNEFTVSKSKGRKTTFGPKTKRRLSTVRKLFTNY